MGTLSPQDVQGIMEMLNSIQEAEAAGKMPPGSYDRALSEAEYEFEYSGSPPGRSANEGFTGRIGNPKPVKAPWRGEYDMPGNFERQQHMANSMANDARLREELGYSRKRTEDDAYTGTFALANYPGLEYAINVAEQGMGPAGAGTGSGAAMTPESAAERRYWAEGQRAALGMSPRMPSRAMGRFRSGTRGMGAREKRRAFRKFVGG